MAAASLDAVPAPPSGLVSSVNGSTVVLTWVTSSGATAYRIQVGSGSGLSNLANIVVGATGTYTAPGVPAGTYSVRVRAIGADGESAASNEVVVVVGGGQSGCAAPPGAPTNLSGSVTGGLVSLSWLANSTGCPPTSYVLQAGSATGSSNLASLPLTTTSFSTTAPVGSYYVRVVAVNAFGTSAPSGEIIVPVGGFATGGELFVNGGTVFARASSAGTIVLLGEVVNQSAAVATFTQVDVTFRSGGGSTLGTGSTFVRGHSRRITSTGAIDDSALAPGQAGCFYMETSIPAPGLAEVIIELRKEAFASTPLTSVVSLLGASSSADGAMLRIAGSARNAGPSLTYFNRPVFFVQRSDGRAIGCDFTSIQGSQVALPSGESTSSGLLPGQTGTFDTVTHAPAGTPAIRAWVQWAEGGGAVAAESRASEPAPLDDVSRANQRRQAIAEWEALQRQRLDAARAAGR
jgi:hypothetical protein